VTREDRYAWWVVTVLTLVYSVSYIDRQMLSLLIGPIQRDLHVSDTGIGMLTGLAFAGVYAVFGVVLGRVADTRNRVGLISISLAVWSVATAACGLAQNFVQLFWARMGVGVGEASLTPAAYSLFSDLFPPRKLGRAVAIYTLAQYFGMAVALVLGALLVAKLSDMPPMTVLGLGPFHPWQLAMVAVSLTGLLALLLLRTVKEPARTHSAAEVEAAASSTFLSTLGDIWERRALYLPHFVGFSLAGLYIGALTTWLPEFFRRAYGWNVDQAGLMLAVVMIGVGAPATLFGGWLADILRARKMYGAPMWMGVGCMVVLTPLTVLLPLAPHAWQAVALLCVSTVFMALPTAVAPAALQLVTPNRMRAQVSAVFLLCTNLIGAGFGPLAVGLLTDYLFRSQAALGPALSVLSAVVCPLAALVLWLGCRPFAKVAATAE
jgi:MFS family permease